MMDVHPLDADIDPLTVALAAAAASSNLDGEPPNNVAGIDDSSTAASGRDLFRKLDEKQQRRQMVLGMAKRRVSSSASTSSSPPNPTMKELSNEGISMNGTAAAMTEGGTCSNSNTLTPSVEEYDDPPIVIDNIGSQDEEKDEEHDEYEEDIPAIVSLADRTPPSKQPLTTAAGAAAASAVTPSPPVVKNSPSRVPTGSIPWDERPRQLPQDIPSFDAGEWEEMLLNPFPNTGSGTNANDPVTAAAAAALVTPPPPAPKHSASANKHFFGNAGASGRYTSPSVNTSLSSSLLATRQSTPPHKAKMLPPSSKDSPTHSATTGGTEELTLQDSQSEKAAEEPNAPLDECRADDIRGNPTTGKNIENVAGSFLVEEDKGSSVDLTQDDEVVEDRESTSTCNPDGKGSGADNIGDTKYNFGKPPAEEPGVSGDETAKGWRSQTSEGQSMRTRDTRSGKRISSITRSRSGGRDSSSSNKSTVESGDMGGCLPDTGGCDVGACLNGITSAKQVILEFDPDLFKSMNNNNKKGSIDPGCLSHKIDVTSNDDDVSEISSLNARWRNRNRRRKDQATEKSTQEETKEEKALDSEPAIFDSNPLDFIHMMCGDLRAVLGEHFGEANNGTREGGTEGGIAGDGASKSAQPSSEADQ